jgi:hypothetical protein
MKSLQLHVANASTPYHKITFVEGTHLSFDEQNSAFKELKAALAGCDPRYPIQIQVPDAPWVDFTHFSHYISFLAKQSTAFHITLEPLSPQNTLLHDLYAHLTRKQAQSPLLAHIQSAPIQTASKKIRRAKQLLNKGQQIQIQTQQQHHQHKEQASQVVQEQQQQVQQQMAQTRENQIQQQQQRLQQLDQKYNASSSTRSR